MLKPKHWPKYFFYSFSFYFEQFITFILSLVFIFAIIAIAQKNWRHWFEIYDRKRDMKDIVAIAALGVAIKYAAKNAKDAITNPLEPKEIHL